MDNTFEHVSNFKSEMVILDPSRDIRITIQFKRFGCLPPAVKRSEVDMGFCSRFTGKPCEPGAKSHINFTPFDSRWEASEAFELDRNPNIAGWVKNDHLGFEIAYVFEGIVHKYRPDFLIKLS